MGIWLSEFKTFILRGNVVDLAVAVVIGAAFTAVVNAFVKDIITPIISIPGKADFSTLHWTIHGSTFLYGEFLNALVTFLIVAAVIFFFVVKPLNMLTNRRKTQEAPAAVTKECRFCLSKVPAAATRCPFCTSELTAA
jgi:large conductance mechanosensitive channel